MLIRLAGQPREIAEPPLGRLRIIIAAYQDLLTATPLQQQKILRRLLTALVGNRYRALFWFYRISSAEWLELLSTLPDLLGLEKSTAKKNTSSKTDSWDELYAHLSVCFSYTDDYIDRHITLSQLKAKQRYLAKHPPTHFLFAAFLSYEYQEQDDRRAWLKKVTLEAQQQQTKH